MARDLDGHERIWRALHHCEADRVGIMDVVWDSTLERWRKEGMPEDAVPQDYFGYDMMQIRPDLTLRFPTETLTDAPEFTIVRDSNGALVKNWKHSTSTPGWLDHAIKSRADWEEHKWRIEWDKDRVDWNDAQRSYDAGRRQGRFIYYAGAICWDGAVKAVSAETLLYGMADDPAWIQEMFAAYTDLYLAGAEEMLGAGLAFDGAWVYDDMGYRNGTFFSPRVYQELIHPQDRRVCAFFAARGMPVILHTCGRVTALIPMLIEAGYTCLQPLEVKAGMDLVTLKKDYGDRLAFMGGIDVRAMSDPDPKTIEREIGTKIPVAMQGGGYIYHSDHSVPDSVSLDQYRRVLELVRQYGRYA
jgi:uroporphyrinogen decarboxylase